jgi:hypothetical protein
MKFKTSGSLLLGLALVLTLSSCGTTADVDNTIPPDVDAPPPTTTTSAVSIDGVIQIPGNPLTGTDIAFYDSGTGKYYLADRGNGGVDIIDPVSASFIGRAIFTNNGTSPPGSDPRTTGGGTSTSNAPGPNGIMVTPNAHLWAGDGNATAQVYDVNVNNVTYLQPLLVGGISTAWNNPAIPADTCDGGTATTHYCGRADELALDPVDNIIMIANDRPLSLTATGTPPVHVSIDPYATFINANPPYNVLGHISFPGASGLEQTIWDPTLLRFVVNVPGAANTAVPPVVTLPPSIQVINPKTMLSEITYPFSGTQDCNTITGGLTSDVAGTGMAGFERAASGNYLVSACGFPIILTLTPSATIPNLNGKFASVKVITQVGGGDEVGYDPGVESFYVAAPLNGVAGGVMQLGVINALTSTNFQEVSEISTVTSQGRDPVAIPVLGRVFTVVQVSAAQVAGTSPESDLCTQYNVTKMGCIAIFTHALE